ncbi:DUF3365 domain-containing protein [bacterium]|nr:DUF3365 domain-containing protein [bacterium]MBU1883398.1 DUF3365 domain-containing protein [bacterium]
MSVQFKNRLLQYTAIAIALIWTAIVISVVLLNIYNYYNNADQFALHEAEVSIKKDLAYRTWVASHGGVYVPITNKTPPNPYLSHIPDRDIITPHKKLTLMNPAYTLSQMMKDYSDLYGVKAKITSKNLLNPNNAPDDWENKALDIIEITRKPYYEKSKVGDQDYLRYLNPLVTKEDCLKCHATQGYKLNDIRGGVAVSIPMEQYYNIASKNSKKLLFSLSLIWVAGLFIIYMAYKKISENIQIKISMYEQNIYSLVDVIEKRDSYTAGHTRRVAHYSKLIATEMGFNEEKIDLLYRASMLHDIGKISTPDSVLLKPGQLSPLEFSLIQEHVTTSYEILKHVDIFKDLAEIVRHHHERYDGKGYPQGLSGAETPLLSYIMSLADAFDAMTTDRIYKGKKIVAEALKDITELSGKQFHPEVVLNAVKVLKDVEINLNIHQEPNTKLERERFSYFYKDQLSDLYNRSYLEFILAHRDNIEFQYNCVYGIYLHKFTHYNQVNGWNSGNLLLKNFADELKNIFPDAMIFRLFGDDFILLHKEHHDFQDISLFKSLNNTDVEMSYKHIDIHNKDINIDDLEKLL